MSKSQAEKIVKLYADELRAAGYPLANVYMFGSYVAGRTSKWSDLDVAVIAKKRTRTLWENDRFLSRISLKVDSRLEPHGFTLKDFADDSDPMVHEIKRTGVKVV